VRDAGAREVLGDLAHALETIREREGNSRAYDLVNKSHINLLRRWSEP
jgi:PKHD-type hydroxylase